MYRRIKWRQIIWDMISIGSVLIIAAAIDTKCPRGWTSSQKGELQIIPYLYIHLFIYSFFVHLFFIFLFIIYFVHYVCRLLRFIYYYRLFFITLLLSFITFIYIFIRSVFQDVSQLR